MALTDYTIDTSGSPQDVQRKQALADALMKQGQDSTPAAGGKSGGWITALNRGLAGALGGYQQGAARQEETQGRDSVKQQLAAALTGNGGKIDPQTMIGLASNPWASPGQTQAVTHVADMQTQAARDAQAQRNSDRSYGLQKRAADRADDPTPDNFVADPSAPGGYRPIGPADPNYIENVSAAKARAAAAVPPDGFTKQPDGTYAPLPGGPQDPAYQARVAAETARAKGDVPTIIGKGGSVIVPNKAADGPLYTNNPPPGAALDDDTLTSMAGQYLAGDKSVFTNIGRGAQGGENIIRLRQRVKEVADAQGMSPADVAHRIAEFSGDMASQRTLGVRQTNADMAVTEAQKMIPLGREASAKLPRGQFVPVNQAIQMYQRGTSSPELGQFATANLGIINTYARAISPTGTPTVHDKEHAERMLSTATSPEQYNAVLNQMEKEMAAAKASPAQVKQDLRDAHSGKKPEAAADPLGIR